MADTTHATEPRGAALLRRHLRRTGQTASAFARAHGLGVDHLYKLVRGQRRYPRPATTALIARATRGEVPEASWAEMVRVRARVAA